MRRVRPLFAVAAGLSAFTACTDPLVSPAESDTPPLLSSAVADFVSTVEFSKNLMPLGFSERLVPLANGTPGARVFNSDLAFWGNLAFQGTYEGFRIIDISAPARPRQIINYTDCERGTVQGNQGDVVVWGTILIRSWNSPAPDILQCGGLPVPPGFEGLHVFDVSNPAAPVRIGAVQLACGSNTASAVPDPANNRLLVYSVSGAAACQWIDIVEVPLAAPANAGLLRMEPLIRVCQEVGVFLGAQPMLACGGATGALVFSLGTFGGSLADPAFLFNIDEPGVTNGKGVAWTWDGQVLVMGHEPGGGSEARCEATDNPVDRTIFFYRVSDGAKVGQFVMPRTQSHTENCNWSLFNVVPIDNRYILVGGSFQAGTIVVDFTDPANPVQVAFADPAPLANPDNPGTIELGGDWSSYWYNGMIYESDMTRGLIVWKLTDVSVARARRLPYLNPQTVDVR